MNTASAINDIQTIVYSVSYHDIMQSWVDIYHSSDTVLVIYDPNNHIEYIKNLGFILPENEMYESKVLVILVPGLDDALNIIKKISHVEGPFVQAWSLGRCITDNIDN